MQPTVGRAVHYTNLGDKDGDGDLYFGSTVEYRF